MLAGWDKKSPLFDPFCGSGTICIEAAMMAAGTAPGLQRRFVFEEFGCFDGFLYASVRDTVQSTKVKGSTDCRIFGSDIDIDVLAKAKANADLAGVGHMIQFEERHFLDVEFRIKNLDTHESGLLSSARNDERVWCVTNPPYGVRLGQESEELVEDLVSAFVRYSLSGGFLLLRGLKSP